MGCQLIPDGHTLSDACFGLNVVFRPMPFGDYDDYMSAVIAASEKDRKALTGKLIADRIVSWEATDADGNAAAVSAENLDRLPAAVGQRLRNLITGQVAPEGGVTQEEGEKNSAAA